jgi:hypothetical protein
MSIRLGNSNYAPQRCAGDEGSEVGVLSYASEEKF